MPRSPIALGSRCTRKAGLGEKVEPWSILLEDEKLTTLEHPLLDIVRVFARPVAHPPVSAGGGAIAL